MKYLVVVRHAKSSWKQPDLHDHDRPLNKRGERDAPFMAKVLSQKKVQPDLIVSSTAMRAFETAKEFAKKLDYRKANILREQELYLADPGSLVAYIQQLPDKHQTVMLFGHNPGITLLVNYLGNKEIGNVPTCGVCALKFDVESWNNITSRSGTVEFFEFPKLYFKDAED